MCSHQSQNIISLKSENFQMNLFWILLYIILVHLIGKDYVYVFVY